MQQGNFNLWEFREELDNGVTDNYSVSLYLNTEAESYRDLSQDPAADVSTFRFDGVSIENRYMVLNPAEHAVGLTLTWSPVFRVTKRRLRRRFYRPKIWRLEMGLQHLPSD